MVMKGLIQIHSMLGHRAPVVSVVPAYDMRADANMENARTLVRVIMKHAYALRASVGDWRSMIGHEMVRECQYERGSIGSTRENRARVEAAAYGYQRRNYGAIPGQTVPKSYYSERSADGGRHYWKGLNSWRELAGLCGIHASVADLLVRAWLGWSSFGHLRRRPSPLVPSK